MTDRPAPTARRRILTGIGIFALVIGVLLVLVIEVQIAEHLVIEYRNSIVRDTVQALRETNHER